MQKLILFCVLAVSVTNAQNPAPRFTADMSNFFITESTDIGTTVYTLTGNDPPPNQSPVTFGIESDVFQVANPSTGDVTLIRKLDHETEAKFGVTTLISDGSNVVRHDVTITVLDANDEIPTFTRETYKAEIFENETMGIVVQPLSATDLDTVNRVLEVTCDSTLTGVVHEGACTTFSLNVLSRDNQNWDGQLLLGLPLDYETKSSYQFPLVIFDGSNYGQSSVEITVLDVEDTPPAFVRAVGVTINEGQPAGQSIEYVQAIDGDTDRRPIRYEFTQNPGNMFVLDPVRGNITTRVIIDRESPFLATGTVSLGIRAREVVSSGPPEVLGNDVFTTATATIQIQVLDINDNIPQFNPSIYEVEIYEDIANNSILPTLLLTVSDADQGSASSYSLTLEDHNNVFYIFPEQGLGFSNPAIKVKNTDLIDYDLGPRQYLLHVVATETTAINRFGGATINITVLDVNDNRPIFDLPRYQNSIPEDASAGESVVTVNVADPDSGRFGLAGIQYTLLGTGANLFVLDPFSGDVVVASCPTPGEGACIDYEQVKSYELTVAAQDENGLGFAVTVPLIINITDINDNKPRFTLSNYVSYINETEQRPVPEILIQASDLDVVGGPLTYTIDSQTVTGLFRLEVNGNARSVIAVRPVEYRTTDKGSFHLTVRVSDRIFTDTSQVTIIVLDINDNAPVFAPDVFNLEIPESTRGGFFIADVSATDIDSSSSASGQIRYSINSGAQTKFEVDTISGIITTTADATFDYDLQFSYTLIVFARDKGQPQKTGTATVFVGILDENNKRPFFTPSTQRADIFENEPNGAFVTKVTADDRDSTSQLEYTFEGEKRAYNPDGVEVIGGTYDFTKLFTIDRTDGSVYVDAALDRDKVALVTYTMVVQDVNVVTSRQTGTGTIIIRILEYNLAPPEFIAPWNLTHMYYNISIREEQDVGTFVMSLIAKDSHSAISEYRITFDPLDYFDVSAQSGVVSISRRIDYDLPSSPSETEFRAMAWDSGVPILSATAMVYVTILNMNDNSPVFTKDAYDIQIEENFSDLSAVLVSIRATDADKDDYGQVRYSLSDPQNRFRIDSMSGDVFLEPGVVLDRESTPLIAIQVMAYDSPLDPVVRRSNTAPLYFRLSDQNDNPPVFTQQNYETSIIETIPLGRQILQLFASDADTGQNGHVIFSNISVIYQDLFEVLENNGVIRVGASLRGKAGTYRFNVSAADIWGKYIVYARVTINVIEATNTQPQWRIPPQANMTIEVLESQYLGMLVYDVHAEDGDKGANGIIDYGFYYDGKHTNSMPEFRINRVTGVIRAEIVYDREAVDRYTLLLVARDQGDPFLENTRFLSIIVLDVNDNIPRFPIRPDGQTVIKDIIVPENARAGQFIGQVEATDADRPAENTLPDIFYYIISGNEEGLFRVDRATGDIYINAALDRETTSNFILYIQASNDENDDTVIRSRRRRATDPSIITVRIAISDVNDNPPVFDPKTYYGCISTEDPFDQTILRVTATDKDLTDVVFYSIGTSTMFAVHPNSGILSNRILMGSNAGDTFTITLTASDTTYEDQATALVFVTSLSGRTKLVVKQPPEDVRLFVEQIRSMLKRVLDENAGSTGKHVVCIDSITDHTQDDMILSQWTDVYIYVTKNDSRDNYQVYDSVELAGIIAGLIANENLKDEFDSLYIANAQGNAQQQQDWMPILVVMIIIFVALFLAILLICLCCYLIRRQKRSNLKKVSQTRTAHPMTIQPVLVPQVYDHHEQSEYATVQKKVPPTDAVFIADPEPEPPRQPTPEPPRQPTPEPAVPEEEPMDAEFHPDSDSDDDMNRYSPPSQPSTPRDDTARLPTPQPTDDDEFRIETVLI